MEQQARIECPSKQRENGKRVNWRGAAQLAVVCSPEVACTSSGTARAMRGTALCSYRYCGFVACCPSTVLAELTSRRSAVDYCNEVPLDGLSSAWGWRQLKEDKGIETYHTLSAIKSKTFKMMRLVQQQHSEVASPKTHWWCFFHGGTSRYRSNLKYW